MVRVGTMTYFQDHSWYDKLADGKLKDETLALKAKTEESWGDATPGVLKFYKWLKTTLKTSTNWSTRPYANIKTKWGNNPHLDTNHIFERDQEASNIGCYQKDQEHKDDPIPEPSNYKVRKFKMMKYSFNDEEEYITIKESEHLNHSKKSLDAYRELLCLTDEGWVMTTPDE
ncbi:hypothetical protein Tco_0364005 [Tanacetum coccineum]